MFDDVFLASFSDRIGAMQTFLQRLENELPQVMAEALDEAARITRADVALLLEIEGDVATIAFATDPTLLGVRTAFLRDDQGEALPHGGSAIRAVAGVADAFCARFLAGGREWAFLAGERGGSIDRATYAERIDSIVDVFVRLLRMRSSRTESRAFVDHVTGLPDRWATMSRIEETIVAARRNGTRAALLFVDLNGFKGVNDSFGHVQGDHVLRSIATTMREALRANEFVGRIGGDEFAVLLPMIRTIEEATIAAQRLADGVRALGISHAQGSVSLSIGIALFPDHAADADKWLHHADLAMYEAKRNDLPHKLYAPGAMTAPNVIFAEESYDRDFLLCFQPIFEVESGKVVGAEALLRSLHPRAGVQSAVSAIEVARARRNPERLDAWVVRKSLAYASEWREQGMTRIHVNVGVANEENLDIILGAIDASGADPSLLALELDGRALDGNVEAYRSFALSSAACGIYVGLDTFGEDAVDLPALDSLDVQFVKPSRALLPSGGAKETTMKAIVALAGVFSWDIIATRVATAEDRAAIRTAGVHYMQGFAVAQPMTAIDFSQWIESSPRIALVS